MGFVFSNYFKIFEGMFELVGVFMVGLGDEVKRFIGKVVEKTVWGCCGLFVLVLLFRVLFLVFWCLGVCGILWGFL